MNNYSPDDIFFEQIVKIKKNAATFISIALVYLLALALVFVMVFYALYINRSFMSVVILLAFGVVWVVSKIIKYFYVEYEYIITNDELDIDKITGKDKRKRLITVNLRQISETGIYDANAASRLASHGINAKFYCCNKEDNAIYIISKSKKCGLCLIIMSPNEKMSGALERVIPPTVVYK